MVTPARGPARDRDDELARRTQSPQGRGGVGGKVSVRRQRFVDVGQNKANAAANRLRHVDERAHCTHVHGRGAASRSHCGTGGGCHAATAASALSTVVAHTSSARCSGFSKPSATA